MQNKCKYKDEEISHKTETLCFFNQLPGYLLHSRQLSSSESPLSPLQTGTVVLSLHTLLRIYILAPGQLDGLVEKF